MSVALVVQEMTIGYVCSNLVLYFAWYLLVKLGSTLHHHFYPQTITIIAGQTESARRWPIPAFAQAPPLGIDWICKTKAHFWENIAFFSQTTLKNFNAKWRLQGVLPKSTTRSLQSYFQRLCCFWTTPRKLYNAGFLLKPFFHELPLTRSKCNQDFSPLFVKRFFLLIWSNS